MLRFYCRKLSYHAYSYSVTKKIIRIHGRIRNDQYRHLSQNKQQLQKQIKKCTEKYAKLSELWKERAQKYYQETYQRKDLRVKPVKEKYDKYEYFTKNAWYKESYYQTIYRVNQNGNEQLLLDLMKYPQLRKFHQTLKLQSLSFDGEHQFLSFGLDLRNNEQITWFIKDLKQNKILKWQGDQIDQMVLVPEGFFYTKLVNMNPKQVYFSLYSQLDQNPILIFQQSSDNPNHVQIENSKDWKYLFIKSRSQQSTLIYAINLKNGKKNHNYIKKQHLLFDSSDLLQVYHSSNHFIKWKQSMNSHIFTIQKSDNKENEQTKLHQTFEFQHVTHVDVFQEYLILYIQKITQPIFRVIKLKDKSFKDIKLPYKVGNIEPGANKFYNGNQILFSLTTPFVYKEVYKYYFHEQRLELHQSFALAGKKFCTEKYLIQTVQVPSDTGELIPLTIISKKQLIKERKKLLMHAYGFYGLNVGISYTSHYLTALENGWTIAYAHVRGGGEKGKKWHLAAKFNQKDRSWKDLISCVAYLIKENYTHPSLLFLHSHSAGAITAWNAIKIYPHLCKGIIMNYPFLDVLGTLLKNDDPLTITDHQQFGNPQASLESYEQIQSFSPYETIQLNKQYPILYLVGGLNDYRCKVDQIIKFANRFKQKANTVVHSRIDQKIINELALVKIQQESSHFGNPQIRDKVYSECQALAFMDYILQEASKDCTYK